MDHFELFGLPCRFELDGSILTSHFLELQRRFHPDKYATASERDRLLAMQKAVQINDAYQTLRNPIFRAQYILLLKGIDLNSEKQTIDDLEFLMAQMSLREQLDLIADSPDAHSLLIEFEKKISKIDNDLQQEISHCLNIQQWHDAAISVTKLKFVHKLKQEIERIEERLLN